MLDQIQIKAVTPRVQYVADGNRSQFFFPFPIFLESNLEVYLGSTRQSSGYVVSGVGETDGGSVTFSSPPDSGVLVTLRRYLSIRRLTDFQNSGQFRAKVLNDELDYITATVQQLEADASRTIRLNPTDKDASLILPEADKRAGCTIVFDDSGALATRPVATSDAPSVAWHTLDDVPDGTVNRHFSDAERTKLSGIAAGAQVNPAAVAESEKAGGSETSLRSFSPKDIRDIASRFADGSVVSVNGRTGAVTAQAGDYSAEQIRETDSKVVMTADERSKLAGIEAGARACPPLVSAAEKASASLSEVRAFSPKDIAEMIAVLSPRSDSGEAIDGGHAAAEFNTVIDGGLASA